jgi:lantibiotic modifying enzyme
MAGDMSSFAEAALAIAHRLTDEAQPASTGVHWHGVTVVGTEEDPRLQYGDTGFDLYSGSAGIGLFLCCAARHDDTGHLARISREAIAHALSRTPGLLDEGRLGLYDGVMGIVVAALVAGRQLGETGLIAKAEKLALATSQAAGQLGEAAAHDLISGTAGIVIGLLQAHRLTGNPDLHHAALAAARDLAASSSPEPWGRSWESNQGGPNLTGLAHGASGPALALQEAGLAADDPQLTGAATEAMRYERTWYSAAHRNWPDLRRRATGGDTPPGYPVFWCHGAAGIGMARLRAWELTGDTIALAEASAAIQAVRDLIIQAGTAMRAQQTVDLSLCHGLAGAAELLVMAAKVLKNEAHLRAARRVGRLMIEHRDQVGSWPCGILGAGEIPDLFLGLAGIGLTLLRLHEPDRATPFSPASWS